MNREYEVRIWKNAANHPEATGYEFSFRADDVVEFLTNINEIDGDTYAATVFSSYISKKANAYEILHHYPEGFYWIDKPGARAIEANAAELTNFCEWLREKEADGIRAAYDVINAPKNRKGRKA